ncbi:MAG: hypothetical protein ACK5AO_08725 [bacterium]
MTKSINTLRGLLKHLTMPLMVLFFATSVFAVDGIIVKAKSSSAAFSSMKKNLSLSLSSGFVYHDNRSLGFKKGSKNSEFNSIISYQKGNIKYILPYKNKNLVHKFKTPQKPLN